jgi:hypothetical protein
MAQVVEHLPSKCEALGSVSSTVSLSLSHTHTHTHTHKDILKAHLLMIRCSPTKAFLKLAYLCQFWINPNLWNHFKKQFCNIEQEKQNMIYAYWPNNFLLGLLY